MGIIFREYKKAYYLSSRKLAFQFFRKHILANDRLNSLYEYTKISARANLLPPQ